MNKEGRGGLWAARVLLCNTYCDSFKYFILRINLELWRRLSQGWLPPWRCLLQKRGWFFCQVSFRCQTTPTSFSRWITLKKINYIDAEGQEVILKQCRMSIFSSTLKRGYGNAPRGKPADPLESMVSLPQITLNSSNLRNSSGGNTRPPALQGKCFPLICRYNWAVSASHR